MHLWNKVELEDQRKCILRFAWVTEKSSIIWSKSIFMSRSTAKIVKSLGLYSLILSRRYFLSFPFWKMTARIRAPGDKRLCVPFRLINISRNLHFLELFVHYTWYTKLVLSFEIVISTNVAEGDAFLEKALKKGLFSQRTADKNCTRGRSFWWSVPFRSNPVASLPVPQSSGSHDTWEIGIALAFF